MKYTKDQIVEMTALWMDDSVSIEEWYRRTKKFGGSQEEQFDVVQSTMKDVWDVEWALQRSQTP